MPPCPPAQRRRARAPDEDHHHLRRNHHVRRSGRAARLLEIPLGVLAVANPGATLAALVTVAGIWCVVIGVMRIVLAFEVRRLPHNVDQLFDVPAANGHSEDAASHAATTTTTTA